MKASKSFGSDYDCLQNWPSDAFLQCGEKGLVISRTKDKPNYTTAFFEAFPRNPPTFIRGEGSNLEEAELAAFNKYQKIINCPEHEYKRRQESEHAVCVKCNLFTSHHFPPVHSCSICNKENVNYELFNKSFCQQHFIEAVESIKNDYTIENISEDEDMFSERQLNRHSVEFALYLQLSLNHNTVERTLPEYKIKNLLDESNSKFFSFLQNKVIYALKQMKEQNPEEQHKPIGFSDLSTITTNLFLEPILYECIFKDFFKIEQEDYSSLMNQYITKILQLK